MNFIVLSTAVGAPLAMLGLSSPVAPARQCVFMLHPQITRETFTAREGEIVFPDRMTEYACSYAKEGRATVIRFENQIGWRFMVRIGSDDEGIWSASKDAEMLTGRAVAPFAE
jgi:hypothetical protein